VNFNESSETFGTHRVFQHFNSNIQPFFTRYAGFFFYLSLLYLL